MTSELLMLVPSRGRPASVRRLHENFYSTVWHADMAVLVDDDDLCLAEYQQDSMELHYVLHVGARIRQGPTLNHYSEYYAGLQHSTQWVGQPPEWEYFHSYIGWMGDDTELLTQDWDVALVQAIKDAGGTGVAYGDDGKYSGSKPEALVVLSADIIRTLGYMCPLELTHFYLDNAWQTWGESMDRLCYVPEVKHNHLHYSYGKSAKDQTYNESIAYQYDDESGWDQYQHSGNMARDIEKLKELVA